MTVIAVDPAELSALARSVQDTTAQLVGISVDIRQRMAMAPLADVAAYGLDASACVSDAAATADGITRDTTSLEQAGLQLEQVLVQTEQSAGGYTTFAQIRSVILSVCRLSEGRCEKASAWQSPFLPQQFTTLRRCLPSLVATAATEGNRCQQNSAAEARPPRIARQGRLLDRRGEIYYAMPQDQIT